MERTPIDEHVIQRVEAIAKEEKQPVMHRGNPCFEWAPGIEIENIFEEENEPTLTGRKYTSISSVDLLHSTHMYNVVPNRIFLSCGT